MEEFILNFLSEFAVFIQNHGFAVSESALAHLLRLVEVTEMEITDEDEILPALSICLAKTGEQSAKIDALFYEFLFQKSIPKTEAKKEKEKQEKKKALDTFVASSQKQLEDLMKKKEQIRQEMIFKAQSADNNKHEISQKVQKQLKKLSGDKVRFHQQTEQAQKLLSGKIPWEEKQATALNQTLMEAAEQCLYNGKFEFADAAMGICKELSLSMAKWQKKGVALESEIRKAQQETIYQIEKLQKKILDEQQKYQNTCRELDRAFEKMKKEGKDGFISKDSLITKPSSVIHRADFVGGGSIQTMDARFIKISEKPFKQLTESEKNLICEYLRQNLLAFKTRMTRNMNSQKHLILNIEETMRESIRTCGLPMKLVYQQPKRSKADLILILDVSGSCKAASELMLTFIGILKEIFPRGCSAFAFVNSLYDISRVYETEDVKSATKQILSMIPRSGQYSNYERPLKSMWKEYRNRISKDSIVIFIGDARNNRNDAGEEYIKNIKDT